MTIFSINSSQAPSTRLPVARRREEQKVIAIFTNGEVTEIRYLKLLKSYLHRIYGKKIQVRIEAFSEKGDAFTLLRKVAYSGKYDTSSYSEVWLVVDEDGADMREFVAKVARKMKKKQQWYAAVSRPCFEVWLIAHYEQVMLSARCW